MSAVIGTARNAWLWRAPVLLLLFTAACGVTAVFLYPFNHDASYLLYASGQVLRGATLYVDVPEINPPLIIWLQLPLAWLAGVAGLPDVLVFRLALLLLTLVSVVWSRFLLQPFLPGGALWSWLATAAYAALLSPGYDWGEREHIALLCFLPYLAEAGRRISGQPATRAVQLKVALLATVGLALKPHFLLAPILVEAYAVWRLRRLGDGCKAAALALLLYGVTVLLFAPQYFDMVRLIASGYWGYSPGFWVFLDAPSFYAIVIFTTLALLARPPFGKLPVVLALAIVGFSIAAIIQQKGWSYHWLPALSLAWILFGLGVAAATAHRNIDGTPLSPLIVGVVIAVLALMTVANARHDGRVANPFPGELAPVIRELGGGPVIIVSSAFRTSFPLVTEPGIGTSTRFPAMTIVTSMERGGNPAAVAWIRRSVAEDFYRAPPRLLLLEEDTHGRALFDFIGYFRADVPELRDYRLVRRVPRFQILAAPAAQHR